MCVLSQGPLGGHLSPLSLIIVLNDVCDIIGEYI